MIHPVPQLHIRAELMKMRMLSAESACFKTSCRIWPSLRSRTNRHAIIASSAARPSPSIILVEPIMGENIGAAARAMKNFGLQNLLSVNPKDGCGRTLSLKQTKKKTTKHAPPLMPSTLSSLLSYMGPWMKLCQMDSLSLCMLRLPGLVH